MRLFQQTTAVATTRKIVSFKPARAKLYFFYEMGNCQIHFEMFATRAKTASYEPVRAKRSERSEASIRGQIHAASAVGVAGHGLAQPRQATNLASGIVCVARLVRRFRYVLSPTCHVVILLVVECQAKPWRFENTNDPRQRWITKKICAPEQVCLQSVRS